MKYLTILAAAMSFLLAGCATTIRSDVTVFHEWPTQLQDKSYVFDAASPQEATLEYRNYQNLVRAELARLGFTEAAGTAAPTLRVAMHFSTFERLERVIEAIDPFWTGPGYWPRHAYYRNPWAYRQFGYFQPYYYDPFLVGPANLRETIRRYYERQLRVSINAADGKKLFDVTVQNTSRKASTAAVMPALVASAFAGFPGQSGVPHRVELKVE